MWYSAKLSTSLLSPLFGLYSDSLVCLCLQEKSSGRTAHYKLTSTVMLWLQTTKTGSGTMNLGGSLTRQVWPQNQLLMLPAVFSSSINFTCRCFTDGKRRNGWRVLTPHRQHRPPRWSQYNCHCPACLFLLTAVKWLITALFIKIMSLQDFMLTFHRTLITLMFRTIYSLQVESKN